MYESIILKFFFCSVSTNGLHISSRSSTWSLRMSLICKQNRSVTSVDSSTCIATPSLFPVRLINHIRYYNSCPRFSRNCGIWKWNYIDNLQVVITKDELNSVFYSLCRNIFGDRKGLTAKSDVIAHFVGRFAHVSIFNDRRQVTLRMFQFMTFTFKKHDRFVLAISVLLM